jgi:hypothetical protein
MLIAAMHRTRLAHSVISLRCKICPLSDNSGQRSIFARDGLSANDPKRTLAADFAAMRSAGRA